MAREKPQFVLRIRKGRPVLINKQIITWRLKDGPKKLRKMLLDARGCPINEDRPKDRDKTRKKVYNPFSED